MHSKYLWRQGRDGAQEGLEVAVQRVQGGHYCTPLHCVQDTGTHDVHHLQLRPPLVLQIDLQST